MRTDEGDEIVEPGAYDLGSSRLHVWLTRDDADVVQMWACTDEHPDSFCARCQEVDGVLNALFVHVIDGLIECTQLASGEFQFRLTQAGKDAVRRMGISG